MKLQTRAIWTNAIILLVFSVGWEFGGGSPVRFGKIYLFDQMLYVSELTRGVRQLDISNPSRPGDLGLVRIDGNHDIALRGTSDGKRILFADSYADLVIIDVTLPAAPQTVDRLTNIFGQSYAIRWGDDILFERPVFGYTSRRVGGFNGCAGCSETAVVNEPIPSAFDGRATLSSSTATGRGGSMARFAVVGDYLYCVDYNQLYVLEISDPTKPRFVSRVSIGWGIETIFPYNNYVFIGGQNGMFIYSISDPRNPKYVSTFTHVRACDPVVVEGSLAYVTLRGGTRCGTLVSALHIVDINDLMKPSLLVSYALPQPMGLDVKNKVAYVCDDSTGVFILDTTNPNSIRELARITDKKGYDTIVRDNLLIVVSEGFVSFYNVSQVDMPFLLGRFQVPA